MISFYHLTHFRWFGGKADFDGFYAIWRVVFNGEIKAVLRGARGAGLSNPRKRGALRQG
jgi:hypothetical protein